MAYRTLTKLDRNWVDQAINTQMQFPDTTPEDMVDGVEVWILFRNMSDVSTVDLRANPSSALDKIMNPNDRDAALATNYTGLTCKGQVWRFVLKITNEVDPLWFCEGVEEKL